MSSLTCSQCGATAAQEGPCPQCGSELLPLSKLIDFMRLDSPPEEAPQAPIPQGIEDIGKFVLMARVGKGGMGEVWKAWDKELSRVVAVKILRGQTSDDVRRFQREAQVVARLRHPNIASIYGIGTYDGKPFLAMPFIEGATIDQVVKGPRQAVEAIRDVARALDFAHKQGVIHRDVKPANIMTDGSRVYLMDFGLARSMQVDSSISASGFIAGTPQYMSPEQARGQSKLLDARSDVYSLGATLYRLLTEFPLFEVGPEDELITILNRVAQLDPVPPRGLRPDIPWELETIVLTAIEKERDRRYQTAGDMADDLDRFLKGEAVRAQRASAVYRIRKTITRYRGLFVASAVALVAAVGAAGYLWVSSALRETDKNHALAQAKQAESEGRWKEALGSYERAGALDPNDSQVASKIKLMASKLEAERAKLEREGALKAAALEYQEAQRELRLLRVRSYQPGWRLSEQEFGRYEALIDRVQKQMAQTGPAADGHWIIGRVRHVLGDWQGGQDEYDRGLALAPDHGPCLLFKGRALMERSMSERFRSGANVKRAKLLIRNALSLVQKAVETGGVEEIELDLARGFRMVVEEKQTEAFCKEMFAKWDGKDFREEFHIIRGFLQGPPGLAEGATRAIQERPGYYEAYFWRAIARQHDDPAGSESDYAKVLEINPRFVPAMISIGRLRTAEKKIPEAMAMYERVVSISPRSVDGYMARGSLRDELKDYKGATEDFNQALQIDPDYSWAYYNRGLVKLHQDDFAGALADYARAIELDPQCAPAYQSRSFIRSSQKDLRGSIEDCSKAIEIDPDMQDAYVNRAHALQDLGDNRAAYRDYTKAIEIGPASATLYNDRGTCAQAAGDSKAAIADYSKALEMQPNFAKVLVNRALVRGESGDLAGAIDDATQAIRLEPRNPRGYIARAEAFRLQEKAKQALADFDQALVLDPNQPQAYCRRGMARAMIGDDEGARKDFDKALELNPKFVEAIFNRALLAKLAGRMNEALEDYGRAIDMDPKFWEGYYNRGVAFQAMGKANEALEDYSKAIELNPYCAEAYVNRGVLRKGRGDVEGALKDYASAGDHPNAHFNVGLIRREQKNQPAAIEAFSKAIAADPNFASAYAYRALAHETSKQYTAAEKDYVQALELGGPQWPHRQQVSGWLKRVREKIATEH